MLRRVHLTLVRHGESTWNAAGRWQGQNQVPLSERGQTQARLVGERLRVHRFDRHLTSDLLRAAQTSDAIRAGAAVEPRLREVDVGEWSGMLHTEVAVKFADQLRALKAGEPVKIGGGESMPEFEARVDGILQDLGRAHPGARVLAVSHGGVIRAASSAALGVRGRNVPLVGVRNTSLSELTFRGGRMRLSRYNDVSHLAAEDPLALAEPDERRRLAVMTLDPYLPPDELKATLGFTHVVALGAAHDDELAKTLGAERIASGDPARAALAASDAAVTLLMAEPKAVPNVLATALALDETAADGFAEPEEGELTWLRTTGRPDALILVSYGLDI